MTLKYGMGAEINKEYVLLNKKEFKTFIPNFNKTLGDFGVPGGSIIEIHGDTATGKTLLALEFVKFLQQFGEKSAFFDFDYSFNFLFADNIGVDLDLMDVYNVDSGEVAFRLIENFISSSCYKIIIIDSIPSILTISDKRDSYDKIDITNQSKLLSSFLFKVRNDLRYSNSIIIFINQQRDSFNHRLDYRLVGGRTYNSFIDVQIYLEDVASLVDVTNQSSNPVGSRIKSTIIKNKYNSSSSNISFFDILFNMGILD